MTVHIVNETYCEVLRQLSPSALRALGLAPWNDPDDQDEAAVIKGKVLWLFPHAWYGRIAQGTKVVTISGEEREFDRATADDDQRFGMLAYGVLVEPWKGEKS